MLTNKKLLPRGIIGRQTLKNYEEYSSEEEDAEGASEAEYIESKHEVVLKFDESGLRIHEESFQKLRPHGASNITINDDLINSPDREQSVESSRMATKASSIQVVVPAKQVIHQEGRRSRKSGDYPPTTSEHRETCSSPTRVKAVVASTVPMVPRAYHFVTNDIIEESVNMSKHRASGISDREFPLISQSSGFSHKEDSYTFGNSAILGNMNYSPLKLNRVYGRNDQLPILNLTGIHISHVVFAASNVIVLFDYYHNHQRMLQGHKNKITCLVKDSYNRYFASGEQGPGSVIIIWDLSTGLPLRTFPVSMGEGNFGVNAIGFVGHEEYLGSIGNEMTFIEEGGVENEGDGNHVLHNNGYNIQGGLQEQLNAAESVSSTVVAGKQLAKKLEEQQNIYIWHVPQHHVSHHHHEKAGWKPIAVHAIPVFVGYQREIVFCDENPEYFVTTGDRYVVFYTWLKHEKRIVHHVPKRTVKLMPKVKKFTTSIWMKTTKWCLTGTDAGYIFAWAKPVPLGLEAPLNPRLNIKEYKRAYRVGDFAITALVSLKNMFIIGDEHGVVKFFDNKFRILRWTKSSPQISHRPINCVACNQDDGLPEFKKEMQEEYESRRRRDNETVVKDWTYGGHNFRQPSETTLERAPFQAPDFIIGCEGGDAFYCHLAEGRADQIVFGTPGNIIAMDTCPNTTHVATCTRNGELHTYDYKTNKLIFSGNIFKKMVEVSCMKFHPSGHFAFFGMTNGQLYFRRAYTWKPMEAPLDNCSSSIERIIFAENGLLMAHFDLSFAVVLYAYNIQKQMWDLRGKHRSHYRPIVDLTFYRDEQNMCDRLFSLGEDKYLIEYDVQASLQAFGGLKILTRYPIDTQFIPTSFVFDSPWRNHKPLLLVASTGNKIKFYDQDLEEVRRQCQGPTYGSAVSRMICVRPELGAGRESKFILLVLGNKIGLAKTPIDGNPYKYMAIIAHPEGIHETAVGYTGREVFTCGDNDDCLFEWEPNITALETCVLAGGSGATPFIRLLDAGLPPGQSLADDVENIFYHLLIRRAKTQQHMLSMSLEIPIEDIPLVLCICGTFLTESQQDLVIQEALETGFLRDGKIPKMISFEDFIKLFANYKEFPPVIEDEIVEAFHVLGELNEQDQLVIPRDRFEEFMTKYGEKISAKELPFFLPMLSKERSDIDITDIIEDDEGGPWFEISEDTRKTE